MESAKDQTKFLIGHLRKISIKETEKFKLKNGNELQVKRLNDDSFRVRIKDNYRSSLSPVMICKIKDDSTYHTYPFLYMKPIVIYGFGGTSIAIILSLFNLVKNDIFLLLLPLIAVIGIQLLLMPITQPIIKRFFRKRLGG